MSTYRHEDRLTEIMDRSAIETSLFTYCRGIDRADEVSLRAAYWPDAMDSHGAISNGPAEEFIAKAMAAFKASPRNIHVVSNILIQFRSSTQAAVESYFIALQRSGVQQVQLAGRYCDVFEKRGDEWRVLNRQVVYDWVQPLPEVHEDEAIRFAGRQPVGGAYPDDPVYRIWRD